MPSSEARSTGTSEGHPIRNVPEGNSAPITPQRPPTPIEVFLARCEALATLTRYRYADLIESVDRLQEYAVASGLVAELGQDWVQHQMAVFFKDVPRC